ncbi:MAG: HEAT repeat domain-containing protein [Planctomycetota bacterium]|nr:HEAT repeat domain-containing protein [Planctomycetota bacterium]
MSRSALLCSAACLLFMLPAPAQPPVFSPPPKPVIKPGAPKPEAARPAAAASAAPEQEQSIEGLMGRVRRWPARTARQAALVLAGLGDPARRRLVAGLEDNDWRIQAGSAFALAEMGDTVVIDPLRRAIRDKANRASLPELLRAIAKIDPVTGPGAIIPHLAHSSGKVRLAARQALPEVLSERYVPDLVALHRSRRTSVRATALGLLARVPGQGERVEFFQALGDPEPQVALPAARHLARIGTASVRARLVDMAHSAPMRQGAYAMLSLILLEDRHQEVLIQDKGVIRKRAQKFLVSDDPFYAGTGAIVLANVSYRSSDPTLREFANKYLCPILFGTVAGGVFFSDYTSLEELCWSKLKLLTEVDVGRSAARWRAWWQLNEEGFVARRELRGVSRAELAKAQVRMIRTDAEGRVIDVNLSGDPIDLSDARPGAPLVLGAKELDALARLIVDCKLFEERGDREDPDSLEASVAVAVRIPSRSMSFKRRHYGATPGELAPLVTWLEQVRRGLAWQRLVPASSIDRAVFVNEQRAFFEAETNVKRRQERLLTLAVAAWPTLHRRDRVLALNVFRGASGDWVGAHRLQLVALLKGESRLTDEASGLVELLSDGADVEVRTVVIDVITATPSPQGDLVLRKFLARQPLPGVVPLMRDERPRVRALAAESLARFDGDRAVVGVLIQGLKDYEPRVQDACLKSLSTMKDERILAMLEAVIASEEHQQIRMRAIEALGMVGKAQLVPRLMELFREGDRHVKWTVIRALQHASGRRAANALASIVRNPGDTELKKEALEALAGLGGAEVGGQIVEILRRAKDPEIQAMAMGSLARVMGARAIGTLAPSLQSADPSIKRMAVLTIARLSSPLALPGLLEMLVQPEGDNAAEIAFQDLTFQVSLNPSPPRRSQVYQAWFESSGARDRAQWFLDAGRESLAEIDTSVDWLEASTLAVADVRVLIVLLQKGNRPVRQAADATLMRVLRLTLDPVGGTEVEGTDRAQYYERWISTGKR